MHPGARFQNRGFHCLVSGCYKVHKNGALPPKPTSIEHCCLMTEGNSWDILVNCRPNTNQCKREKNWKNVMEVYPDAKVERKHNNIELTLPVLTENLEVAAFGVPKKSDQKRMQMAVFGKDPTQGCNWKIRVYLIDDSKRHLRLFARKKQKKETDC
ncbi:unnamed protein product [Pocillopora meandrina]|uniref:Uncharacterized protein n=1 Tax=Pocillopora meandrina TaxID=46732 RepID=A0AAU9X3I3_9CNID|nr:unnamed protein product [Pocillopora meandrina]